MCVVKKQNHQSRQLNKWISVLKAAHTDVKVQMINFVACEREGEM